MTDENLQRDLDAIESEKEDYLSGELEERPENREETEEKEIEEISVHFNEDEINEWINELTRLKEDKSSVDLEIDDYTILKVNYSENSSDSGENLSGEQE